MKRTIWYAFIGGLSVAQQPVQLSPERIRASLSWSSDDPATPGDGHLPIKPVYISE